MIQKGSVLPTGDNSGVLKTRVFHVYKGAKGRIGFVGDFFKVSAREVLPENPILKKVNINRSLLKLNIKIYEKMVLIYVLVIIF